MLPSNNASQDKLANERDTNTLPASSHYKPGSESLTKPEEFSRNASVPVTEKVQATPAVRKLAKENNIDLTQVNASGPKGRVTKEDVLLFIQRGGMKSAPTHFQNAAKSTPAPKEAEQSSKSTFVPIAPLNFSAQDQKVPIRGVQRLMVKSMTAALKVQHLTFCEEVDFENLKKLRSVLKSQFSHRGVKISYMPLLIKITSLALTQFPQLNATVNDDVTEMIYHGNHNIGVAMDTDKGLIVPVIKSVQNKSVFEIAQELNQLQVS